MLRVAAGELVVGLEKAVGRHEQTAAALRLWHGELADFQWATLKARDTAVESARLRARAEALQAAVVSAPGDLVGAGLGAALEHRRALEQADMLLGQARQALATTLGEHRERDRYFARLIDDATDDEAQDGRWDNVKDWVDRNEGWLDG